MKTPHLRGYKWLLAVTSITALLGCLDEKQRINAQNSNVAPAVTGPAQPARAVAAEDGEAPSALPSVSPAIAELAKLAQASVNEEVLLAYIKKQPRPFNPTADDILYLNDLGVSDAVITALVDFQPAPELAERPVTSLASSPQPAPTVVTNVIVNTIPETRFGGEVATSQPAQVNNYFYESLAPYGSWVDVDGYGSCWRPSVVVANRSWRPYCDRGRWLYTDSGWYWQSDYSWGWAPFHYGRWHSHNSFGWVWVPGDTWGPSWVSWRYGGGYSGWAPLPPVAHFQSGFGFSYYGSHVGLSFDFGLSDDHYTFIPSDRFCDRYPYRYALDHHRARNVYKNTTVINNYVRGDNNTIINEGIGRNRVQSATRTEVRKVALRDMEHATAATSPKRELMDRDSNALHVYRPQPVLASAPSPFTTRSEVGKSALSPSGAAGSPLKGAQPTGRAGLVRKTDEISRSDASRPKPAIGVGTRGSENGRTFPATSQSPPLVRKEERTAPRALGSGRSRSEMQAGSAEKSSFEQKPAPLGQSVISRPVSKTEIAKRTPTPAENDFLTPKPSVVPNPGRESIGRPNGSFSRNADRPAPTISPRVNPTPEYKAQPMVPPVVRSEPSMRQERQALETRQVPSARPQPSFTPPVLREREPVRQPSPQPQMRQAPPVRAEMPRSYSPPVVQQQMAPQPRTYSPPPQQQQYSAPPKMQSAPPSYSAPSRPAPSYSPPAQSRPQPQSSQSAERPSRQELNKR